MTIVSGRWGVGRDDRPGRRPRLQDPDVLIRPGRRGQQAGQRRAGRRAGRHRQQRRGGHVLRDRDRGPVAGPPGGPTLDKPQPPSTHDRADRDRRSGPARRKSSTLLPSLAWSACRRRGAPEVLRPRAGQLLLPRKSPAGAEPDIRPCQVVRIRVSSPVPPARTRREATMPPDHRPTPAEIIGELLTSHPEAPSLLAEASHCRALAACSAVTARVKFAAAQAARLAYEELWHRLEPRRRHPIHFGVGLLLLLILSAGLAMLVLIELSGLLGGRVGAARAGRHRGLGHRSLARRVAVRQRRWALVAAMIGAGLLLGLLLVALHGLGPASGLAGRGQDHGSNVFGALTGAFILVLTAGAAALMAHMEPASVLMARQRWHLARAAHEAAAATQQADVEAAAIALEAWLGLVRAKVAAIAAGDELLVRDTVSLAAGLVDSGRPQLPPAP